MTDAPKAAPTENNTDSAVPADKKIEVAAPTIVQPPAAPVTEKK